MKNIKYTDGHFHFPNIWGESICQKISGYSQNFVLELFFLILTRYRNGGEREGGRDASRGGGGQDEGGQEGPQGLGITPHDNDPDHVTVIIRLILISTDQ